MLYAAYAIIAILAAICTWLVYTYSEHLKLIDKLSTDAERGKRYYEWHVALCCWLYDNAIEKKSDNLILTRNKKGHIVRKRVPHYMMLPRETVK